MPNEEKGKEGGQQASAEKWAEAGAKSPDDFDEEENTQAEAADRQREEGGKGGKKGA